MPGISFAEARRSKQLMETYRTQWAICQRHRGWLLLIPALAAIWLTWLLLTHPDLVANTDRFVQWMLALPAIGMSVAVSLSILAPRSLFSIMHPVDRDLERRQT